MNVLLALAASIFLFLVGTAAGATGARTLIAVVFPYVAVLVFFGGMFRRLWSWSRSAVPFRIPTTCGQQKSLDWIRHQKLDNPHTGLGAAGRMLLEVLFFRSLLRNTRTELAGRDRLVYATDLALWAGAMAMHWSLLVVLLRHLRLFTDPVPGFVTFLERGDGFFEIGMPGLYVTSAVFPLALAYLLYRRLVFPRLRYISLAADYFPLFLLLGIALSGITLRYFVKTDIEAVKEFTLGLVSFHPVAPASVTSLFFGHLFLACVLLVYFPFSKLVHVAGVFLSPTRNLANNNRAVRHVNPWDYPVKVHTYEEYEEELRDKMIAAGIPVERQEDADSRRS